MTSEPKMSGSATQVRLYNVWQNSRDFYSLLMSTTVREDAYSACEEGDVMTEELVWVGVPR